LKPAISGRNKLNLPAIAKRWLPIYAAVQLKSYCYVEPDRQRSPQSRTAKQTRWHRLQ